MLSLGDSGWCNVMLLDHLTIKTGKGRINRWTPGCSQTISIFIVLDHEISSWERVEYLVIGRDHWLSVWLLGRSLELSCIYHWNTHIQARYCSNIPAPFTRAFYLLDFTHIVLNFLFFIMLILIFRLCLLLDLLLEIKTILKRVFSIIFAYKWHLAILVVIVCDVRFVQNAIDFSARYFWDNSWGLYFVSEPWAISSSRNFCWLSLNQGYYIHLGLDLLFIFGRLLGLYLFLAWNLRIYWGRYYSIRDWWGFF